MTDKKKPDVTFPSMLTPRELADAQSLPNADCVGMPYALSAPPRETQIHWITPPCEHYSRKAPSTEVRIRRGLEKFRADGETFEIVDITVRHGNREITVRNEATYRPRIIRPTRADLEPVAPFHDPAPIRAHIANRLTAELVEDFHMTALENDLRTDNIRVYLELEALKNGTEDQRERYAAGFLPEEELTQLARNVLFEPLAGLDLRRWASRNREMLAKDLKHAADHSQIEYETCDVDSLSTDEWKRLKAIQAGAEIIKTHPWCDDRVGGKVEVTTAAHWATCKGCGVEAVRHSAKVTIHWAGRQLVREWSLTDTAPARKAVL